jgi:hypothetical protein
VPRQRSAATEVVTSANTNLICGHRLLLFTAKDYSISATITTGPHHPLGSIFGDLLVPPASANGRHPRNRHIPFEVDHRYHLGHSHHFDLLNHPAVYDAMEAWLQKQSPARNADAVLH